MKTSRRSAEIYGCDISKPATTAKEAVQALYFGYLGAVKDQNGAAMSLGRTSTFLDIYFERDFKRGILTEEQAQELIDHFIMKLRLVRFARTPEYNSLFSGDPQWVTESLGGMGVDGRSMVTKNSFRYLHTLENLGTAPEPNMTVLWSTRLPEPWKEYCAKISINTSSIQYENDDLMRVIHGDDYAIACCVSSMVVGKEMQFFGARANLAKCLLYAINGGVDEISGVQVATKFRPITSEYLDYDDVMEKYDDMMTWLAELYVNTLNIIHYMHDKYCYESLQMALHDREVKRYFATGIAGISVVADSLSAIKYAKVKAIRDEQGIVVDYRDRGRLSRSMVTTMTVLMRSLRILLNSIHEQDPSAAHYTDTVFLQPLSLPSLPTLYMVRRPVSTPDGRKLGVPLAPGANPMQRQRYSRCVPPPSLPYAKLQFSNAQDGISNTFSIIPDALGKDTGVFVGDLDIDALCPKCANIPNTSDNDR